ncbi:hypothetical protein T07_10863 [Trichinella nelsoni]|uniref:Uncharacterized protein n=1 Tax=Trichinella nelsoni TaxID=6336 RepID=A0A0V0SE23_9BILA|nr:hypothetical protein T07_10863 [Trichinella nelsoni]
MCSGRFFLVTDLRIINLAVFNLISMSEYSIPVQLIGLWSWNHVVNHFNIINGYIRMFSTRFQEFKITKCRSLFISLSECLIMAMVKEAHLHAIYMTDELKIAV